MLFLYRVWSAVSLSLVVLIMYLSSAEAEVVLSVGGCEFSCSIDCYYQTIPELNNGPPDTSDGWSVLINKLQKLLQDTHVVVPYTSNSETDVWDALTVLDMDPNNASNVWLIYSNRSEPNWNHGDSSGWNREHLLPRSYGLYSSGPDYSDLHNLRPADSNVNSARNNLYFDDCYPSVDSTCTQPAHSEAAADTAKNSLKFMPPEATKGEIARSVFYMALRYNGTSNEANTEQLVLSSCPCVGYHYFGNLSTMLTWSEADPVTEAEIHRNNLTCALFQHNRNPFVDFPWLRGMFDLSPAFFEVEEECIEGYTGDPDECTDQELQSSSPTPSPHSNIPTNSFSPTIFRDDTHLGPGDVAVISFISDNPDAVALVALRSIPRGTQVSITDNGWTGTSFRGGEGVLIFHVLPNVDMPAGTVWCYPTDECSSSEVYGDWEESMGTFALSTSGDQVMVYVGSYTDPNFIYAMSNTPWQPIGVDLTSSTTTLPASLNGTQAYVSVANDDNSVYAGPTEGTQSGLLNDIADPESWTGSSSTRFIIDYSSFSVWSDPSSIPTHAPGHHSKHSGSNSINDLSPTTRIILYVSVGIIVLAVVSFGAARLYSTKMSSDTQPLKPNYEMKS